MPRRSRRRSRSARSRSPARHRRRPAPPTDRSDRLAPRSRPGARRSATSVDPPPIRSSRPSRALSRSWLPRCRRPAGATSAPSRRDSDERTFPAFARRAGGRPLGLLLGAPLAILDPSCPETSRPISRARRSPYRAIRCASRSWSTAAIRTAVARVSTAGTSRASSPSSVTRSRCWRASRGRSPTRR